MALAPGSAPIKTGNVKRAAEVNTEREIEDIAARFTENLMTYNFRSAQADMDKVLRDTTDGFEEKSHAALGGDIQSYERNIVEAQGTSSADVKGTTVTSRDEDTATVLVVASREFDSKDREQPARLLQVVELTMLKTDDGWKVDNAANPAAAA